ncbi:MAG: hypothetical protein QF701_11750 [Nitrospinota bacterium]|nr:hypothetical protein [Nitrospinota bacterium]
MRYAVMPAIAVFIALAAPVAPAASAAPVVPGVPAATRSGESLGRGLRATAAGRYGEAIRLFAGMVKKAPGEAAGYFFLASVYNILAGHFDDAAYRAGFDRNISRSLALSEERIKATPADAEAHLIAGLTMGLLGMDAARRKSYVRAFVRSRRSKRYLERAVALDPGLEDAYYGLGLYYFWRVRAKWLRQLAPLLGDTGEKGLAFMRRAAWGGGWLRDLARIELVYSLYAEKQYEEAGRLIDGIIADYPGQPHYLFARAEGYFIREDFKRARAMFGRLRRRFIRTKGRVEALFADYAEWRVVRCDYRLGNTEAARRGAASVGAKPGMNSPLIRQVRAAAVDLVKLIDNEDDARDRFPAFRKPK